jgi:hypothetical protein
MKSQQKDSKVQWKLIHKGKCWEKDWEYYERIKTTTHQKN